MDANDKLSLLDRLKTLRPRIISLIQAYKIDGKLRNAVEIFARFRNIIQDLNGKDSDIYNFYSSQLRKVADKNIKIAE
ncbi:MAG TPA: hypothetical protein VKY57_16120 [Chitinispirillaceae bacterium]|nr:hypothetical protein [Chitinispirillaceae bacterium]